MTIRMLIEGHSDPVSAKRLGVSPRTYAGYVADLKQEYDAETRFQLGYAMGARGVSGNETPERGRPSRRRVAGTTRQKPPQPQLLAWAGAGIAATPKPRTVAVARRATLRARFMGVSFSVRASTVRGSVPCWQPLPATPRPQTERR